MMRTTVLVLVLMTQCVPATSFAATGWQVKVSLASVIPDGESELIRPNGKIVTTDIDAAAGLDISVNYRFNRRLGLSFGYLGSSSHTIDLHQEFPDSTDFSTSDRFHLTSAVLGLPVELMPDRDIDFYVEPFLAYVRFDDVFLESAGPPFDIVEPLDLRMDEKLGVGATLGVDVPLGDSRWTANASLRVLIVELEGRTPESSTNPGFSSGIGLDFNAISLGFGVGYRF